MFWKGKECKHTKENIESFIILFTLKHNSHNEILGRKYSFRRIN